MKKSLYKTKKGKNRKKKTGQQKLAKKITKKKVTPKTVKRLAKIKTLAKAKVRIKSKVQEKIKATKTSRAKAVAKTKTKIMVAKTKVQAVPPAMPTVTRSQTISGPVNVKPYQVGKHEGYMNKKQLEHFRNVLLQWKSQLMAEVDRTMHHMQDEVSNYPDPVDRASQEEEFSLELRARDRERKLLRKIEETLSRINDNDYGYCDDCGAEIGVRRLEARPTATQCIECKTISEIREKQIGESG